VWFPDWHPCFFYITGIPMDPVTLKYFLLLQLPWVLLAFWTVYALAIIMFPHSCREWYNYYVFVSIPSVFVTLGILGTFSGIVHGLQGFDNQNLQRSMPIMIEGLKTAFYTSIYGIVFSLVFRKPVSWRVATGVVKAPRGDREALLEVIASRLTEIKEQVELQVKSQGMTDGILRFNHAQITTLLKENASQTHARIDDMSERMAQANSEALVGAIQEVITDFNRTFQMFIGELVEKNFDKLSDAVDQLVDWQGKYREDIISIRDSYSHMLVKFEELVKHGESWVETMDSVAGSGSALQQVVDEFNIAFADNSKFRITLEKIHAAAEELKQGAVHLKDLGLRFDNAALAFGKTQEHVDEWSTSAQKVAGMVADLQGTLVQLREFDIAQIPALEQSFVKRMEQTMRSFDDLIKNYITYLEKSR
jgi:hypothetical protein